MKIGVCVKIVPDTETRIKIGADEKRLAMDGVSYIISPYDEFAIEEALKAKERAGQGEVVLISVGDDEAVKILRNGLAMGADRAIQVNDPAINPQEPYDIARVLAQVIQKEGLQLVLFGKQGVGQDFQQMPALVVRPNEIARLDWGRIDLQRSLLTIDAAASKVRHRRMVNLHPTCVAWLKLGGELPSGLNRRRRMDALKQAAKIRAWPHDVLRHTAASHLVALHGARIAAETLGHSETMLFKHYRELVTSQETARFWKILPS